MFLTQLRFGVLAALALAVWPVDAQALPCTFGAILPPANLTTSTDCEGSFVGNDTEAAIAALDPFGTTNWVLADKSNDIDDGGVLDVGDNAIILSGDFDGASGTWSVANGFTNMMITMKAGNDYAAFLIAPFILSGLWSTDNLFENRNGVPLDLSHLSIWYDPTSTAVPLPPALLLFGSGLVGLGFLSRRRARKQRT